MQSMLKSAINKRMEKTTTSLALRPSPSPSISDRHLLESSTSDMDLDGPTAGNSSATTGNKRRRSDIDIEDDTETIDLTGDGAVMNTPPITPAKRPRTKSAEDSELERCRNLDFYVDDDQEEGNNVNVEDEPSLTAIPTPSKTPSKAVSFESGPAPGSLADRYIATPTRNHVQKRTPHKFSLKPPYWKRWTPAQYAHFAQHLTKWFDASDFARETGLPVEEIQHVFTSLVANPLYVAKEAAKRGEEGMERIFELANKYGTQMRHWGRARADGKRVYGELADIEKGGVALITKSGAKCKLGVKALVKEDFDYIQDLTAEWCNGDELMALLKGG